MYDESVKGYWHVYSDGKKADIPFSSDADKIYAMNSVAICAFASGMEVICLEVNDCGAPSQVPTHNLSTLSRH